MQAIVLNNSELKYQADYPDPVPSSGEVMVEVIQAGVCETDLQLHRGYMGFCGVLGHEFVGVALDGLYAGHRVVGEINCCCRVCDFCVGGMGNHCPSRTVIGIDRHEGAFADLIAVPEANLHAVPDSVSDDQAVFVEPLAAAFQISQQVELDDARVAVLGDGRLSMLCVQVLLLKTANVTVIGKHAAKLARFESLPVKTVPLRASIKPKSFDVVVDCTGSSTGMASALNLVRPRGTVVMKTTIAGEHQLSLASIVIDEITVVGSRCGPFDQAIDALQWGTVDVSQLITHRFALHQAEQAMRKACDSDAMKVVFAAG